MVVLSGAATAPATDPAPFFASLVGSLVRSSQPVVAGETLDSSYDFVALVRKDGAVDGHAVTVDDADTMPGRVAVVLALRDLLADAPGACVDYGFKKGACDVVPGPAASP